MNTRRNRPAAGLTLIEALVALAVMAFGLLAVIGVQTTLRANADISKQRTEAIRIAQLTVEDHRAFRALAAGGAGLDFDEIETVPAVDVAGINAMYSVAINVPNPGNFSGTRVLQVTVSWRDRADQPQSVQLSTSITRSGRELAASLVLPQAGGLPVPVLGRKNTIPRTAKDLGNGTSAFRPPQGLTGNVFWVINNTTGVITSRCTLAVGITQNSVVAADVAGCSYVTPAQLVSGTVRFARTSVQPDEAEATSPTGTSLNLDLVIVYSTINVTDAVGECFDDSSDDAAVAAFRTSVVYYCALPNSDTVGRWAGRSRIRPLEFLAGIPWVIAASPATAYKVCRYTPLTGDIGTRNGDHPLDYTTAGSEAYAALVNQNFLVISAAHTCPTDTPSPTDFINSNTRLHQDGSATYDNPP